VEVSSFQLDTIEQFSPMVSLLLNITPDHLDRYTDYEAYVRSKLKIYKNQRAGQFAILNDDDERLCRLNPTGGMTVLRYGFKRNKGRNAFIEGNGIVTNLPGKDERVFSIDEFHLPGRHNLENLMGVVLAASCIGLEKESIEKAISNFRTLSHRMEYSGKVDGVDFYDDSKATNVDAAIKSIGSFKRPVILIAGGIDKGGEYHPLVEAAVRHVKKAVFLGEARSILARSFEGIIPYTFAESMEDAVSQAFSSAQENDVVLLAPACSSFDMFSDYVQRGRAFKKAVNGLGDDY
jgi:UDP-N-acetylmuramoylalanine--D-glutamate ligase